MSRKIGEKHPDYLKRVEEYEKARDFGGGQGPVTAQLEKYLPLMDSHESASDPGYLRMHQRAWLFEGTVKTVEALVGLLFRHDPTFEPIDGVEWFDDVDGCGTPLVDWSNALGYDLVNPGRIGVLATPFLGPRLPIVKTPLFSTLGFAHSYTIPSQSSRKAVKPASTTTEISLTHIGVFTSLMIAVQHCLNTVPVAVCLSEPCDYLSSYFYGHWNHQD